LQAEDGLIIQERNDDITRVESIISRSLSPMIKTRKLGTINKLNTASASGWIAQAADDYFLFRRRRRMLSWPFLADYQIDELVCGGFLILFTILFPIFFYFFTKA